MCLLAGDNPGLVGVVSYDRCKAQCARLFWRLLSVRRVAFSGCGEQDAGATATADQALIRASKAHTGIRREIPVSVAREYGERRSPTNFGEFSDRLRHPGHRIVFVQDTPPYRADPVPTVSMSVSPHCGMTGVTALLPATPFMAGSSAVDGYQDHTTPLAPDGLAVCATAQMKPTSSRATAVIASGDFLPRAIRRR
jgi:hypothetical protein